MFSIKGRIMAALVVAASLVAATFGQQAQPAQPAQPAQTPAPRAETPQPKPPEYVEEKGFKGKVFEIKHRDPAALVNAIGPLASGFRGARVSYSNEFGTITVRDFPENIAAIEEAIKRLDTPEAQRPDIEFHVNVLIASNAAGAADEYPPELSDVVKQLQSALRYKSYALMTSSIHRTREGRDRVENNGVAESRLFSINAPQGNPIFYNYSFNTVSLDAAASTVQIGPFSFQMRVPVNMGNSIQYENVGFRSPVSLRQGEKVVVGTTSLGDKGLVVVLWARIIK